ncbi:PadR family transcriptional regulator [Patulibacter defluvii]|uniref:PadR family transcriptional regulator n=1 Tax=Patulibacter defluvii TaxID=3095358 RepID=UPI002A76483D|nr:PadR family transcriptional regulator [Patulibacter sp. DM4]
MKVNHATLVVLALLGGEPMHGHQIRRVAEIVNLSEWAEVSTGSIYNTLRRLADDGSIVAVRTEQEGNRPPRTVYTLTEAGHYELERLREIALTQPIPDASVMLALIFTAPGSDPAELRQLLTIRREKLVRQHEDLVHLRERKHEQGAPASADVAFRAWEMQLAAAIAWHDEVDGRIDELCAPEATIRAPDHRRAAGPGIPRGRRDRAAARAAAATARTDSNPTPPPAADDPAAAAPPTVPPSPSAGPTPDAGTDTRSTPS